MEAKVIDNKNIILVDSEENLNGINSIHACLGNKFSRPCFAKTSFETFK